MSERPGVQVGDDLLDDGVIAVLALGLDEGRVGEHGVIPPRREQFVLPLSGLLVAGADAADDQPGGDLLAFLLRRERGVPGLRGFRVGDPALQLGRVGCPARS
jgi:hypothetical protein